VSEVAEFMFTASVALQNIDHRNLKAAFKVLGVDLPSRRTLSGRMLDERYKEVSTWWPDWHWSPILPLLLRQPHPRLRLL
jgi:hypothetical protein